MRRARPDDLQFIDTMIAHHQGALEMAKSAQDKASRPEIKTLAQNIIAEKEKVIARMKEWRENGFPVSRRRSKWEKRECPTR